MSQTLLPASCCCGEYPFDVEIDADIGAALKGGRESLSAEQVPWADRETSWRNLEAATVGVLSEESAGDGELTLGRYAAGHYQDYDETHINIDYDASYATRVPITFDTLVLAGLTVTRAVIRIEALLPVGAGTEGCVSEDFDFGVFTPAGAAPLDGSRNTATPDLAGLFEIELPDPDTLLNKAGDTVLELRFLSDVNASLPAGHTFDDFAAFSAVWAGWTYAQAWLMDSGVTRQVRLLVEVA